MKDVKLFHSKYTEADPWMPIIANLKYEVFKEIQPHEKAIVIGGLWENPTVFNNPVVFYKNEIFWTHEWYVGILKEYYNEMINVTNIPVMQVVQMINDEVDKP